MTMYGRSSRWAAALALGLAGLIGVGAALVLAAPARTAASAFELTLEAEYLPPDFMTTEGGTFRSRAPFCAGGTFVQDVVQFADYGVDRLQFTCDDGTGSLAVGFLPLSAQPAPGVAWRILDGSGSYAALRGIGTQRWEQLCDSCDLGKPILWRGTLMGVVDWGAEPDWPEDADTVAPTKPDQPEDADTVAPTIAIASARAAKLLRPAGAYSIKVALALRDDVEGNPVSYRLRVATARGIELTRRFGTATTGAVSMTLRIRPPDGARLVRLQLTGVDPVGNAVSVRHALRLPR
jgi:hypothetical protein